MLCLPGSVLDDFGFLLSEGCESLLDLSRVGTEAGLKAQVPFFVLFVAAWGQVSWTPWPVLLFTGNSDPLLTLDWEMEGCVVLFVFVLVNNNKSPLEGL